MITIGIACWISEKSQLPELKRCLDSVTDYNVILVNGKWYDVQGDYPISLIEARDMMDMYSNVTRIDYPDHHEWECRNLYLERCDKDDILIVLDTDEYLVGTFEDFAPETDSFMLKGYSKIHGGHILMRRGISKPTETIHIDRHNQQFRRGTKLDFIGPMPTRVTIYCDKQFRSQKIEKAMYTRNHLKPYR